jgi:hypothetical protein
MFCWAEEMKTWVVECTAGCGCEEVQAETKEAAIEAIRNSYDHDRVPHENILHWMIKEKGTDQKCCKI